MKRLLLAEKTALAGCFSYFCNFSRPLLLAGFIIFSLSAPVSAQDTSSKEDYKKVVTERAAKIVSAIQLTDPSKSGQLTEDIALQYVALNGIHDKYKTSVAATKKEALSKENEAAAVKKLEDDRDAELSALHKAFIARLQKQLSSEQVEMVKDGMTYRILPITYKAYLDMLPRLTEDQKKQIYAWLTEARERAMDEGSSERKHAVFGKYKGRINNYLSAAGYDMKKEGEEWQKRIKEREAKKSS